MREGHVRDVVPSGDAVVETSIGLVFARGGLPGETVRIALEPKSGRIRRGRIAEVIRASDARVEPACQYAERCGGCGLMHASPEAQRALRTGFLREALRKAGAAAELPIAETPSDEQLGYRRRARLSFRRGPRALVLGFRRDHSRHLVDVEHCIVLAPALDAALVHVRARLTSVLEGEGELSLALGAEDRAVLVVRTDAVQSPAAYGACAALVEQDGLGGVALYAAGASKPATWGDPVEHLVGHDGAPLAGTIGGFSQAHATINRALVARVATLAQTAGARVLELYAGSGNFTVALAQGAQSYTAVEQSPDAVRALRQNVAARGLSVKVVEGDVDKALAGPALDVVVLDPPRTGAPGVLLAIASRKPRRIVYVSCDPATLGRDVATILPRGYAIASAEAFEMFPQTADLESVVLLERT